MSSMNNNDYDYEEKSIGEMLEDSVLVQIVMMFYQIVLMFLQIFFIFILEVIDCIIMMLGRVFKDDRQLVRAFDFLIQLTCFMKPV